MASESFLIRHQLRLPRIGAGGLILFSFSVLTGCTPHPAATPLPQQPSLQITFQATPANPRQLDPTTFTVRIADKSEKPISDAAVMAELAMPTMDMGRNAIAMNCVEPGRYTGSGRFTMAGSWTVTVHAARGKDMSQQTFPVEVQ